jgi:nicotinate-nucleotide adenylyltransferase
VKRIGVLGGTFDPVHVGHLAAAVAARHALRLDRMLLVVANHPWQKADDRVLTPAEDRYAVTAAAAADVEGLEASRIEIDRGGDSYMADTLAELAAAEPGADLFLVLGADVAAHLETWVRWEEVRRLATLAVVHRPGAPAEPDLRGWRHEVVEAPWLDVSSSLLRSMAHAGKPLDALVPPAALHCIRERGLYAG